MSKRSGKKTAGETRDAAGLSPEEYDWEPGCMLYVSRARPEEQGKSLKLTQGEVFIGRSEECDLTLEDESVSRRHVKIILLGREVHVEDLGSKNGISYLGKKIEKAVLRVGARIFLGDCGIDFLPLTGTGALPVSTRESYGELVGTSVPMRRLYALLETLENSDTPVLIEGETGTGKELVARALHDHGLRAGKPFVIIDCGNMPAKLMESELFGHRKGAFTGALADHTGAFEAANGGTVFLDEMDELPLDLQPKLLRVLESSSVKRLGDVNYAPVDVRVLAATKRSLSDEAAQERFRRDLYYRIAVVHVTLPSLRERPEDIPDLVNRLAGQQNGLPPETLESFLHHDWPGNVRELRNAVQRTLALGLASGLPVPVKGPAASGLSQYQEARARALADFDRAYLTELMKQAQGNLSAAARSAGISRSYLRDLLKKHGLYKDS